ncbi:MAG: carbamoyl-phosphate synthase (glutamine-hydrolyzing) large subunit [Paludibacteraceae bacterium]|nr:carbamoyl-phosphate synthase (glutamine-hydrolyzing) large subunit [Paludibacteraceae bacterium]
MRHDIHTVLLLGSGALKIGQAGEFDYSGSQALKAMREEGIRTVLINPNIATVQTSEGVADKVYFLPVTPDTVERVIEREHPDGILLSFGGQTALNCGVELYRKGILQRYGVRVLGTPVETIMDTEDRELFVRRLDEIDVLTIRSYPASSIDEAKQAAEDLGYPLIVRAAYALGGLGSGFVDNDEELTEVCEKAFAFAPQVLVEKSLRGWKEIEYEVMRDRYDNCITVCNMENFDPLGIHTGESIVVAPSQTLSNSDFHFLRELAIRIVRHLGIVGECNVQFAYDPDSTDYRVIEVNARLSRSSALASKATGYPLAFVAAKLGLGYGLFELKNSVTKTTPAFFEPALDYVVCKIPRWDLNKFQHVSRKIGSSMKSVGEVMSIGRTFEEAMQKGLRMIGQGAVGFAGNKPLPVEDIRQALSEPTDTRIFVVAQALELGMSVDEIYSLTRIDRWFLNKLRGIVETDQALCAYNSIESLPVDLLRLAKRQGFSDERIQQALYKGQGEALANELKVRAYRQQAGIVPYVKQIDTLAAEFPAQTNYLYLTYNGSKSDLDEMPAAKDQGAVIVLGSGAYRIGSSVEFDWCSVMAMQEIRAHGYRGVMINYNPETVSTDYDQCDRLYFDELTLERVLDICELEHPTGVVVSVGGQIPNNLALPLHRLGIRILGTSAENIDRAEDRHKFSSIVDALGIDQPEWAEVTSMADLDAFVARVGFPILVRPSYVLSGAAMNVCHTRANLERCLSMAAEVSQEHPVVVSRFITRCKEIEFDAVADHGQLLASAISEHIEFAGVHSGDATIVFPAQRLYVETVRRIKRIAARIAAELDITGPFNIQFLAKENQIKVIECNLRASRSFPFVSKVLKINLIRLATQAMLGMKPAPLQEKAFDLDYVGVKSAQFSFARLENADPMLRVDMCSTGEVGCLGNSVDEALMKSILSVGQGISGKRVLLSTGDPIEKAEMLEACRLLARNGYELYATGGTYKYLVENDIPCRRVLWPSESSETWELKDLPGALEMIHRREVDLVINIPKNFSEGELTNGYRIRRAAIDCNIPLYTNARLATAFIRALCAFADTPLPLKGWDEY